MTLRSRKTNNAYNKRKKFYGNQPKDYCVFCNLSEKSPEFVAETKSYWIVENTYPYSFWDQQAVADHLLVCPKKHTEKLDSLTAPEAVELVDIIASYENKGYNFYARAPYSNVKSIPHQHTHLIKPKGKYTKFLLFTSRPYIRISK